MRSARFAVLPAPPSLTPSCPPRPAVLPQDVFRREKACRVLRKRTCYSLLGMLLALCYMSVGAWLFHKMEYTREQRMTAKFEEAVSATRERRRASRTHTFNRADARTHA